MSYIFLRHLICNHHISGWNKSPLSVPLREKGFKFVVSIFSMGFTPVDFCETEFEINFSWQSKRFYQVCIIIFLFSSFCPSPPCSFACILFFLNTKMTVITNTERLISIILKESNWNSRITIDFTPLIVVGGS